MEIVHQSPIDDNLMMDGVPTSIHLDLTELHNICCIMGPVEVDKPSFHSPALDSLSQAARDIIYDGTPDKKYR